LKIGFVGYTTATTPQTTTAANVDNLSFKDAGKPEEATFIQNEIDACRSDAQHPDAVVLLAHEGGEYDATHNFVGDIVNVVHNLSGLDMVMSAHTHQTYNVKLPDKNNKQIPVAQGGFYGRSFLSTRFYINKTKPAGQKLDHISINIPVVNLNLR
jgi:2',3'-cyclic-nucleotide 2'-phosphodiesterase (5'-nucleotidase family)